MRWRRTQPEFPWSTDDSSSDSSWSTVSDRDCSWREDGTGFCHDRTHDHRVHEPVDSDSFSSSSSESSSSSDDSGSDSLSIFPSRLVVSRTSSNEALIDLYRTVSTNVGSRHPSSRGYEVEGARGSSSSDQNGRAESVHMDVETEEVYMERSIDVAGLPMMRESPAPQTVPSWYANGRATRRESHRKKAYTAINWNNHTYHEILPRCKQRHRTNGWWRWDGWKWPFGTTSRRKDHRMIEGLMEDLAGSR